MPGLLGLTRSLARELGPHGICVNTVLPGAIQVDAEKTLPGHHRAHPKTRSPASVYPAEVSTTTLPPAVAFFAAPSASFITGQSLHIDGGWILNCPIQLTLRGGHVMKARVPAVLITPTGTTLLMKRIRPTIELYWVLVGGQVEDTDPDHEAALLREIREEIAGKASILRLFHQTTNGSGETEYIYLA
ncbi:MAG: SDR family oxidoreductase, partial [Streptomyces sp.]|nr:SDR family oxidoreductase [Streptomyces sp.]